MPQSRHGRVLVAIYQVPWRAAKNIQVSAGLNLLDALRHESSQDASQGLMVLPSIPSAPKSKRKVPITQLTSVDDIPTLSVFWPEEQEGDASEIDRGHVAPGGSELGDEWKALAELQTLISPLDTMDSNVGMASDVVADVRKEVETQSHEGILRLLRKTLEEVEGVLTHRDDRMKLLKGIECQLRNDKESWEVNQKGLEDLQQKLQNKRICL